MKMKIYILELFNRFAKNITEQKDLNFENYEKFQRYHLSIEQALKLIKKNLSSLGIGMKFC